MFSNPGQLPPIEANSLLKDICKEDNLPGFTLYNQFNDVIILTKNNRLNHTDSDAVIFNEFLDRLRDSKNTEQD